MKILGYIAGIGLCLIGGVFLIGAFVNAVGINLLSDGPSAESGNGVLGIALAGVPLVLGLVILSKLQKKSVPDPNDSSRAD